MAKLSPHAHCMYFYQTHAIIISSKGVLFPQNATDLHIFHGNVALQLAMSVIILAPDVFCQTNQHGLTHKCKLYDVHLHQCRATLYRMITVIGCPIDNHHFLHLPDHLCW